MLLLFPVLVSAQVKVNKLTFEYKADPLGVQTLTPKLSWILQSDQRNVIQTAYRVLVADDSTKLNQGVGNIWDSKRVSSSASIQVVYAGKTLQSTKTYYWKVMVWDNHGHASVWSSIAKWQMGIVKPTDWKGAKWIAYNQMPDSMRIVPFIHGKGPKKLGYANDTLPLLRKAFNVSKPLKKATMYISGLGHFELSINGGKTGDHFLDPGWTQYDKQVLYVPFDVTKQLKQGRNAIGVMLGNGFYYIPRDKRYRKLTGAYGYPKMICRLVL
ncbi:MAG: alpha-L-rhamnosidase N-terminal domain-containing protein, partial [Mucilaginibacter sp.]